MKIAYYNIVLLATGQKAINPIKARTLLKSNCPQRVKTDQLIPKNISPTVKLPNKFLSESH